MHSHLGDASTLRADNNGDLRWKHGCKCRHVTPKRQCILREVRHPERASFGARCEHACGRRLKDPDVLVLCRQLCAAHPKERIEAEASLRRPRLVPPPRA